MRRTVPSPRLVRVSARDAAVADVHVSDIRVGPSGTEFALVEDGGRREFATKLLGRHAAMNSALALTLALRAGVTAEQARDGLARLKPVTHRLEIVRNDSVVVIDDAYSSNPEGFSAALEVLGSFPGRRILITPGMVELGAQTVPAHERVAKLAAQACDIIVLVGGEYPPEFPQMLQRSGFSADALVYASDLNEATAFLGAFLAAGDVVLFENDLPDNFR